jgi:hypothetical protein
MLGESTGGRLNSLRAIFFRRGVQLAILRASKVYPEETMPKPTQKYLFLHRSQPGHGQPSPEQMQVMFAKWNAWKEKFKDNIVDWGDKLKSDGKVVSTSGVSDGPFVEAKEIIGGFMIVSAESLEHAVAIAQEMPAMQPGARIEVREMAGAKM